MQALALAGLIIGSKLVLTWLRVEESTIVAVEAMLLAVMTALLFAGESDIMGTLSALLVLSRAYTYRRLTARSESEVDSAK